jgi:hypothetical protein
MSFKYLADTFSVSRESDQFVQVKTLKNPNTEDQVWVAFKIEGEAKFSRGIIQSIIETLEEVFFDQPETDVYERFENTLKEVNVTYRNLKQKRGSKAMGSISAIVAVFSKNELHITQAGEAEAYLVRKGRLSMITEGLAGRSEDLFINIASGELLPEDKIVLSTSRLLRLATHNQLAQIANDGVTESIDSIRELVMANSDLTIGVAVIHPKLARRAHSSKLASGTLNPIFQTLRSGWERVIAFIEEKTNKKGLKVNRNNVLIALFALILLLLISVTFLMNGNHNQALREEYRLRIEAMHEDLHTANTKGYANDKDTANAILERVETQAREILETEYFRSEALALLDKVQKTKDSINNTVRVSDITPYVDLSTKRENVEALGMVNLDDNFYVYEYNALYEIILDQVLDPRTIDETEVVVDATAMEDQNVIVLHTQSNRIIEYEDGQFRFVSTDDENWKPGVDLATYGRYLYILSPSSNQIYKYSRLRNKYSTGAEYSIDADLEDAISLAIDGSIYVLKEGGEIIKLYKSKEEDFALDDMATDISEATKILTFPEHSNLYVFDPVKKRVVIIEKDVGAGGRYKGQVYFEDLEGVKDFYVDKKEDKLYLLTHKQIYEVEI